MRYIIGVWFMIFGIYCIDMATYKLKKGNESHRYLVISFLFFVVGILNFLSWIICP